MRAENPQRAYARARGAERDLAQAVASRLGRVGERAVDAPKERGAANALRRGPGARARRRAGLARSAGAAASARRVQGTRPPRQTGSRSRIAVGKIALSRPRACRPRPRGTALCAGCSTPAGRARQLLRRLARRRKSAQAAPQPLLPGRAAARAAGSQTWPRLQRSDS